VQALIEQLQPTSPSWVVVESTGGLERTLVRGLQAGSIPVAIANPRQVKGFAIALGKAKTDKLDAHRTRAERRRSILKLKHDRAGSHPTLNF
jgi:transposase